MVKYREVSIDRLEEVVKTINPRVIDKVIWVPVFLSDSDIINKHYPNYIIVKIGYHSYKIELTNPLSDMSRFFKIIQSTYIDWIHSPGSYGIMELDDGKEITIHLV